MAISVTSSAFAVGETIPDRYTCQGEDLTPPLAWTGVPAGTAALAVVCEDPDAARLWTHWILYNLPPELTALPEGIPDRHTLENGAVHGSNDSHTLGYSGPCPPHGQTHRYYYRVYALDTRLTLPEHVTGVKFRQAIAGHILAQGEIMGRFGR